MSHCSIDLLMAFLLVYRMWEGLLTIWQLDGLNFLFRQVQKHNYMWLLPDYDPEDYIELFCIVSLGNRWMWAGDMDDVVCVWSYLVFSQAKISPARVSYCTFLAHAVWIMLCRQHMSHLAGIVVVKMNNETTFHNKTFLIYLFFFINI